MELSINGRTKVYTYSSFFFQFRIRIFVSLILRFFFRNYENIKIFKLGVIIGSIMVSSISK